MSNLVKYLNSIELETLDNIRSSKSANTIRAYKSDFNHFIDFCKKNNFKSLPADPKIVFFAKIYKMIEIRFISSDSIS